MYVLNAVPLESNSIKLVLQVWNCVFRWLYGGRKGRASLLPLDNLFDSYGMMSEMFTPFIFCLYMRACSLLIKIC